MAYVDLTGMRFGKLAVLNREPNNGRRQAMWKCKCDCGTIKIIPGRNLLSSGTKSCGCLQRESVPYKDLTGNRYGRLVVIKEAERPNGITQRHFWLCKCDCGKEKVVSSSELGAGRVKSCGCLQPEVSSKTLTRLKTTHGKSGTRLYNIWSNMKIRCYNKGDKTYALYGARGIKVCDEWLNNYESFYEWAMKNGYDSTAPRGHCTLDRIDNDGDYCPENCRWATQKEQCNNTRKTRKITYNGETHTISEWAEITGTPAHTISDRLSYKKWSIEDVLFKPRRIWDEETRTNKTNG